MHPTRKTLHNVTVRLKHSFSKERPTFSLSPYAHQASLICLFENYSESSDSRIHLNPWLNCYHTSFLKMLLVQSNGCKVKYVKLSLYQQSFFNINMILNNLRQLDPPCLVSSCEAITPIVKQLSWFV